MLNVVSIISTHEGGIVGVIVGRYVFPGARGLLVRGDFDGVVVGVFVIIEPVGMASPPILSLGSIYL